MGAKVKVTRVCRRRERLKRRVRVILGLGCLLESVNLGPIVKEAVWVTSPRAPAATSQQVQKKKKRVKIRYFFGFPRAKPHLTPLPTTQFTPDYLFFGWLTLYLSFFSLLFSLIHSLLSSSPPTLPYHHHHHFHHNFSGKITEKFLRTHKHLHILFLRKKFLIFLVGFALLLEVIFI